MKCYVCDVDNWHERKDLNPKMTVGICRECGNIAMLVDDKHEKEMIEFYRSKYRGKITTKNLIFSTRKLNYIKIFISDWIKDKKGLICGDVGCATGYFINWLRQLGHKATGCELTLMMRRFCENYYNIPLTEELTPKHKYDLISIYHVLEHMTKPDEKLMYYKSLLKDDGVMLISVPEYLYELKDLSLSGVLNKETYFHEYHLCCFTKESLYNLLWKCGLQIIKEDREQYGLTILVNKIPKDGVKPTILFNNWGDVNKKIDTLLEAIKLQNQKQFEKAKTIWPRFPEAWNRLIFDSYRKDPDRQAVTFEEVFKLFPESLSIILSRAVWNYQYQKYEESLKDFLVLLNNQPHEDYFVYAAWCYEGLKKPAEAMTMMQQAININPSKWTELTDHMCGIAIGLPTWDEKAKVEIMNKMFNQTKPKIELEDPLFAEEIKEVKKDVDKKGTLIPIKNVGKESESNKQGRLPTPKKTDK